MSDNMQEQLNTRSLKKEIERITGLSVKVRKIPSKRPNTYVEVWIPGMVLGAKEGGFPNSFRKFIVDTIIPNADIRDWNNISYGNIKSNSISLKELEWEEVLKNLNRYKESKNMNESTRKSDTIDAIKRAFMNDLEVTVEESRYDSTNGLGWTIESVSGKASNRETQWIVFDKEENAEKLALDKVTQDLEDEPETFNIDFIKEYLYLTNTDQRLIAQEDADFRIEDRDVDEIVDMVDKESEYSDMQEELEELQNELDEIQSFYDDESNYDEMLDEIYTGDDIPGEFQNEYRYYSQYLAIEDPTAYRVGHADWSGTEGADKIEELERSIQEKKKEIENWIEEITEELRDKFYDEIYEALEDPIQYFVHEQGIYSVEDLLSQNFININIEEAAQAAIDEDGVAHFLDGYDGQEEEITDPKTKATFYAYGTN